MTYCHGYNIIPHLKGFSYSAVAFSNLQTAADLPWLCVPQQEEHRIPFVILQSSRRVAVTAEYIREPLPDGDQPAVGLFPRYRNVDGVRDGDVRSVVEEVLARVTEDEVHRSLVTIYDMEGLPGGDIYQDQQSALDPDVEDLILKAHRTDLVRGNWCQKKEKKYCMDSK